MGRQPSAPIREGLEQLIARQSGVVAVSQLWVTYVGPRKLWVVVRIETDDALDGRALKALLRTIERAVQGQASSFARVDVVPI